MKLIERVIEKKDLPLTIVGLPLRMRPILALLGLWFSTMATTIGIVRRMRIIFGVLEGESDLFNNKR